MEVTRADIGQVLAQMRALAAQAQGPRAGAPEAPGEADFGVLLARSVEAVNKAQSRANALSERFEKGEPGADLVEVMVAREKASLSFQAMVQVRNRLVSAYQDIMNMPV